MRGQDYEESCTDELRGRVKLSQSGRVHRRLCNIGVEPSHKVSLLIPQLRLLRLPLEVSQSSDFDEGCRMLKRHEQSTAGVSSLGFRRRVNNSSE
jgi:hypothetical protein